MTCFWGVECILAVIGTGGPVKRGHIIMTWYVYGGSSEGAAGGGERRLPAGPVPCQSPEGVGSAEVGADPRVLP
eukprot:8698216-Pyramimonas_sp.AAC.1